VVIGFGNDPGSAFNTVLRPVFTEQGLGAFCMTGFSLPSGVNVTDGTNATIQYVKLSPCFHGFLGTEFFGSLLRELGSSLILNFS
jgi:hypothetical protein